MRQVPPLTPRPNKIEDRIDDFSQAHFSQAHFPRPTPHPIPCQDGFHQVPLFVRQVAWIGRSCCHLSPRLPSAFLTPFYPASTTF